MISQIIANLSVLKLFSKIDIFKVELGNNLTGAVEVNKKPITIKITDEFVKRYQAVTNKIIFRYGKIGTLIFYQDETLKSNEFTVFDGDSIYEIDINNLEDFKNDPKTYLNELIIRIEGLDETNNEVDEKIDIKESGRLISTVPKEIETPKINLPKDQYIEEMVNRRKKLSAYDPNDQHILSVIEKRKRDNYVKS